MRHWRQKWDPDAELIATRRLRLGDDPKKPFVLRGEVISADVRETLGLHRLQRWFESGILALADFDAPEPQRRLALREKALASVLAAQVGQGE